MSLNIPTEQLVRLPSTTLEALLNDVEIDDDESDTIIIELSMREEEAKRLAGSERDELEYPHNEELQP